MLPPPILCPVGTQYCRVGRVLTPEHHPMHQHTLTLPTPGRGLFEITRSVGEVVRAAGVDNGLCQLFVQHTSASLTIQENADPDVLRDLETWMSAAVIDGDLRFSHRDEGPDDMSAHVRSVLTQTSLIVPIQQGVLALGTWQAIYLWEHRTSAHRRRILVSIW